jgi:hypothetical protein
VLRHGPTIARLAGIVFVVLAAFVVMSPRFAEAIVPAMPSDPAPMTNM